MFNNDAVCPGSSDPFYIVSLLYKMGHYFLDILYCYSMLNLDFYDTVPLKTIVFAAGCQVPVLPWEGTGINLSKQRGEPSFRRHIISPD